MQWQLNKKSIYGGIVLAFVLMTYNAIAGEEFPQESIVLTSNELRTSDTIDVITKFVQVSPVKSTIPAIGDSASNAIEASTDLSETNTMLVKSEWKYVVQIIESGPDTLEVGNYKAELFENDKSKGVLFFNQTVDDPEVIEGVTAAWDIGNDVPTNAVYNVKVTKSPINAGGAN